MEETEKKRRQKETEAAEKPENEAAEKSVKPETTESRTEVRTETGTRKTGSCNRGYLFTTGRLCLHRILQKALGIEKEEAVRLINVLMLRCEENQGFVLPGLKTLIRCAQNPNTMTP